MDADELLKIVINARDTITSAPSPHIIPIALSNLFSTPQYLPPKTASTSLTPKMVRVRSIALSSDVMTFTGSLDFLNSQDIFDIIFGDDFTMLTITPRKRVSARRRRRTISLRN